MNQAEICRPLVMTFVLLGTIQEPNAVSLPVQGVLNQLSKCVRKQLSDHAFGQITNMEPISKICDSPDCLIIQYEEAVKNCAKPTVFHSFDFKKDGAMMEEADNISRLMNVIHDCVCCIKLWKCLDKFVKDLSDNRRVLAQSPIAVIFNLNSYGSALQKYIDCTTSTKYTSNGSCTASERLRSNDIHDICFFCEDCAKNTGVSFTMPYILLAIGLLIFPFYMIN